MHRSRPRPTPAAAGRARFRTPYRTPFRARLSPPLPTSCRAPSAGASWLATPLATALATALAALRPALFAAVVTAVVAAVLGSVGMAATAATAATAGAVAPGAPAPEAAAPAADGFGLAALDPDVHPVAPDALARIHGGFCTTCSDGGGGGGGGGTGSSGSPTETGSPYWETYRVSLNSSSTTPSSLVNKVNNYSDAFINGTFTYTRKVVRDVQFSGGYASFVKAAIGGEVSESTQTSVTYPIAPHTYGKLYVKYRTERRTYYGHKYQDFTDGTRTVVGSESGPYLSTSTILGYVTGTL